MFRAVRSDVRCDVDARRCSATISAVATGDFATGIYRLAARVVSPELGRWGLSAELDGAGELFVRETVAGSVDFEALRNPPTKLP